METRPTFVLEPCPSCPPSTRPPSGFPLFLPVVLSGRRATGGTGQQGLPGAWLLAESSMEVQRATSQEVSLPAVSLHRCGWTRAPRSSSPSPSAWAASQPWAATTSTTITATGDWGAGSDPRQLTRLPWLHPYFPAKVLLGAARSQLQAGQRGCFWEGGKRLSSEEGPAALANAEINRWRSTR